MNLETIDWAAVLAWLTVPIGILLIIRDVKATLYFLRHGRRLGFSWVVVAFYRTSLSITLVVAYVTVARVITLVWDRQPWLSAISGIVFIWLLLIPALLENLFRSHEG